MKVLFFRFNREKTRNVSNKRMKLERLLYFTFVLTFLIMVIVQVALVNPTVRAFLTVDNEFEGTPLGVEEFIYKEGEIGLELLGDDKNYNLKVLINGDEIAVFNAKTLNIKVLDDDVVEIDGSSSLKEAEVAIVSISDNIHSENTNVKIKVNSNIKKLIKIKME